MHEGKKRRLDRVFGADGKILVVAMDHAAYMPDAVIGLENPGAIIAKTMPAGADALLTTLGTLRKAGPEIGTSAVIMSVESFPQDIEEVVLQALRYDVDMIKVMVYPFDETDPNNIWKFQKLATMAEKWNLPIMAEVFPGGYPAKPEYLNFNKLSAALRVTAEAGADVIKTFFIEEDGHPKGYREIVENTQIPIVVLGGEKSDDPRPLLEKVKRSIDSGARGVAIGRNIWGHPRPDLITSAVAEIIHHNSSVETALGILK
jgi:DhnA family fructose-bisphosphate aldolase class Ia